MEERKKRVQSSHLALRFYKHDGWTRECLEPYLRRGRISDQVEGQEVRNYYFLDHNHGSQFDMDRLHAEQIGEVDRWYSGPPRESDIEFLKGMNG